MPNLQACPKCGHALPSTTFPADARPNRAVSRHETDDRNVDTDLRIPPTVCVQPPPILEIERSRELGSGAPSLTEFEPRYSDIRITYPWNKRLHGKRAKVWMMIYCNICAPPSMDFETLRRSRLSALGITAQGAYDFLKGLCPEVFDDYREWMKAHGAKNCELTPNIIMGRIRNFFTGDGREWPHHCPVLIEFLKDFHRIELELVEQLEREEEASRVSSPLAICKLTTK